MHILSLECQCQLASKAQCFHSLQHHEAPLCALKATAALLNCLIMSALAKKQAILSKNFLVLEVSVMLQQLVCNLCVCFQFGLALWVCWGNWRQVFYWNKIILNKSALLSLALAWFGVNLALYFFRVAQEVMLFNLRLCEGRERTDISYAPTKCQVLFMHYHNDYC